ncbi:MAG: fimbrial protein, partial [Candidatus Cryptobacteroides sp.]
VTALACGCGQKMEGTDYFTEEGDKVTLDVSVPLSSATKVTDVTGETTVNSLQVFVFRKDGVLEAEARESGKTLSLSCTTGEKDVYAVTNAPQISGIRTLDNLKSKVSSLSENSPSSFVMSGMTGVDLDGPASVEIEVKRLVARVCIRKITNNFTLEQYRTGAVRIKGIYLLNAQSSSRCLGGLPELTWTNLHTFNSTALPDLLYSGAMNAALDYGTPYETANYFYCYPNPTADDSSEAGAAARFTRLVVEVDMGGTSYYYPVSIPGIERNKSYEITELTITRLGSASPDEPVSSLTATFTLKVLDWEPGSTLDPTI